MRAYRVEAQAPPKEPGGATRKVFRFAGTNADARQARDAMVNDYGVKKKEVEIEETEIPTAKAELIEFINGLVNPAD